MSEKFDMARYESHRKSQGLESLVRYMLGLIGFICVFLVCLQMISVGLGGSFSLGRYETSVGVAGAILLFMALEVAT